MEMEYVHSISIIILIICTKHETSEPMNPQSIVNFVVSHIIIVSYPPLILFHYLLVLQDISMTKVFYLAKKK